MLKWSRAKRKCREEIKEEQSGEIRRLDWRDAALYCGLVLLPLLNVRLALQEEFIFFINNSKTDFKSCPLLGSAFHKITVNIKVQATTNVWLSHC